MKTLLTIGNPKTQKGVALGYLTAILHLAPYKLAGAGNMCADASPGCIAGCLNLSGRGGIFKKGESTNAIQEARIRKTQALKNDRAAFLERLAHEIGLHVKRAHRLGLKPSVRLNGTSDLPWEGLAPELFKRFPEVLFYDYTKSLKRASSQAYGFTKAKLPSNYSLTYSRKETDSPKTLQALVARGVNVAVPFLNVPDTWEDMPVHDGDEHDLRFLDPKGVIIGLKAKGPARKDLSGFTVRN